jgi:hypothetical protein
MRRNYISPEYYKNPVYGTFNSYEESNFFSSKMLEVEDIIEIINEDIIYYQKTNGEQLDLSVENALKSEIYSSSENKNKHHRLYYDQAQNDFQLKNNTKWILEIDARDILIDYLFATLKRYRTFEGVRNDMNIKKNVDSYIREYIENNVLNRYKLSKVSLFIKYEYLRNQSTLRFENIWNSNLTSEDEITKFQLNSKYDYSKVNINFNQQEPSLDYSFNYYYNLKFEKI